MTSILRGFDSDANIELITATDQKEIDWLRIVPLLFLHLMCLGCSGSAGAGPPSLLPCCWKSHLTRDEEKKFAQGQKNPLTPRRPIKIFAPGLRTSAASRTRLSFKGVGSGLGRCHWEYLWKGRSWGEYIIMARATDTNGR